MTIFYVSAGMLLTFVQTWFAGVARNFRPLEVKTGTVTYVEQYRISMATDQRQWQQIWDAHRGVMPTSARASTNMGQDPPSINFKKDEVLALFGGQLKNVLGFRVYATFATPIRALVRISPLTQHGFAATYDTPYLFVVLPKVAEPIEIQFLGKDTSGKAAWIKIASFSPGLKPHPVHASQAGGR